MYWEASPTEAEWLCRGGRTYAADPGLLDEASRFAAVGAWLGASDPLVLPVAVAVCLKALPRPNKKRGGLTESLALSDDDEEEIMLASLSLSTDVRGRRAAAADESRMYRPSRFLIC